MMGRHPQGFARDGHPSAGFWVIAPRRAQHGGDGSCSLTTPGCTGVETGEGAPRQHGRALRPQDGPLLYVNSHLLHCVDPHCMHAWRCTWLSTALSRPCYTMSCRRRPWQWMGAASWFHLPDEFGCSTSATPN